MKLICVQDLTAVYMGGPLSEKGQNQAAQVCSSKGQDHVSSNPSKFYLCHSKCATSTNIIPEQNNYVVPQQTRKSITYIQEFSESLHIDLKDLPISCNKFFIQCICFGYNKRESSIIKILVLFFHQLHTSEVSSDHNPSFFHSKLNLVLIKGFNISAVIIMGLLVKELFTIHFQHIRKSHSS